jgi:cobalt transporter subunit CbtB
MTTRILSASASVSQRVKAGVLCLFLGGALVFGVGLAQSETLHNAAHDTRHAIGFPCH